MKNKNLKKCNSVREWMKASLSKGLRADNSRLYYHILNCERCQQRLFPVNKVNNALMMIKSQSHDYDLLAKANRKAIGVLKHGLRENPKVEPLKHAVPKPGVVNIFRRCNRKMLNAAACFAVFFLFKTHIFNSIEDFQAGGDKIVSNYYQRHLGKDLARQLEKL